MRVLTLVYVCTVINSTGLLYLCNAYENGIRGIESHGNWRNKLMQARYGNKRDLDDTIAGNQYTVMRKDKNDKNKDKNGKNKDKNKDKGKEKDKGKNKDKDKGKDKGKKKHPTASPTPVPPTIDLSSQSCALYCDGISASCTAEDGCCDSGYTPCDAFEFDEEGLFHCGKDDTFLGDCVEHDVIVHAVSAPECSLFCDGTSTAVGCGKGDHCCPEGFLLCNSRDLVEPDVNQQGFHSELYRCARLETFSPTGRCTGLPISDNPT